MFDLVFIQKLLNMFQKIFKEYSYDYATNSQVKYFQKTLFTDRNTKIRNAYHDEEFEEYLCDVIIYFKIDITSADNAVQRIKYIKYY